MVDALREAWRVLAPTGALVDLRPEHATRCPIELVAAARAVQVGEVDASGTAADDRAADRAVQQLVEDGRFLASREAPFPFELYWDTVDEMAEFMERSMRMGEVRPAYAALERIHRTWRRNGAPKARVRATRPMWLAVYRKGSLWRS